MEEVVVAYPVYFGSITAQFKAIFYWALLLRGKVFKFRNKKAGLAVNFGRN